MKICNFIWLYQLLGKTLDIINLNQFICNFENTIGRQTPVLER